MNKRFKKTLVTIGVLLSLGQIYAQSAVGFMGKRSELSIEAFSPIAFGHIPIEYKFNVSNSVALYGRITIHSQNRKMLRQIYTGNSKNEFIEFGDYSFKGFNPTIGFHYYAYPMTGMPAPIGYHYGFSFGLYFDELSNNFLNGATNTYEYKAKEVGFNYGRSFIITGLLTLDIQIRAVVRFGKFFPNEENPTEASPYYRRELFFTKVSSIEMDRSYDSTENFYKHRTLYVLPRITLGYLF